MDSPSPAARVRSSRLQFSAPDGRRCALMSCFAVSSFPSARNCADVIRFRLIVEFDGRPFMGWQRQAHGPTVQQAIEEAIGAITHERVTLHAAGRTDAGVHALAMSAHVDI